MIICSIDQSLSCTAICIFDVLEEKLIHFQLIKSKHKSKDGIFPQELRIKEIVDELLSIIEQYECQYVFLEGLSFGSVKSRSSRELGGLFYAMLISFLHRNIKYSYFAPTTVKAFASKGHDKKDVLFDLLPENVKAEFEKAAKKTTGLFDLSDSFFIGKLGISKIKSGEIK